MIVKAEHGPLGTNPHYVATNLDAPAQELYDEVDCARGEMEHRIKEQPLGLFTDRTSRQARWANQFRVLLSACAYTLMVRLRTLGLKGAVPGAKKQRGQAGVSTRRMKTTSNVNLKVATSATSQSTPSKYVLVDR